jgi:hypothetical protein
VLLHRRGKCDLDYLETNLGIAGRGGDGFARIVLKRSG